jgi:hypothetical protein
MAAGFYMQYLESKSMHPTMFLRRPDGVAGFICPADVVLEAPCKWGTGRASLVGLAKLVWRVWQPLHL